MGKPTRDPEIQEAMHQWWKRLTLEGDPTRRPDLAWEAFEAGYRAARCMPDAAPDLFRAIVNSDDVHWTPAMRAAMAKATGATS